VGALTGVFSFNQSKGAWTSSKDESGKSMGFARSIAWSADGKIWVRSLGGHPLAVFEGGQWRKIRTVNGFEIEPAGELLTSSSGSIWWVQNSGIHQYDSGKWQGPFSPPERTEQLFSVYPDEMKSVDWIASRKKGSLTRFVEAGIEARDGDLWMATRSVVVQFSPLTKKWAIHKLPIKLVGVFGVYEDSLSRIWFCDSRGTAVAIKADRPSIFYDLPESLLRQRLHFAYAEFSVNGICQDNSGQLLFATDVGLVSLNESRNEWSIYTTDNSALPDNHVSALLLDRAGRIWVGTGKGIVVLER
jgi:ligand-binding sensor domain-containing protein